jgi:hypothetical protein
MKAKYLIPFLLIIIFNNSLLAQEPADALRYSYLTQPGGTARNQAIGGAGASLGGEFSSLFINPAGLGFYKTGDFVLTPGYSLKTDKSTYLNTGEKATKNSLNLGASGIVFSTPAYGKSARNYTIGIGINRTADFNNHIYYSGVNNKTSFSEKYLEELVNNNVTDPNSAAQDFQFGSSQAYNTYLIEPTYNSDSSSVTGYRSLANPAFGLQQQNTINTTGGITDVALAGAVNLQDKWFIGGTLTFPFLNYNRNATYVESDISGDQNNNFNFFQVDESLQTKGVGINGKFGVIYKPVEDVRLGLAFHTPTFYQLTDNYNAKVTTDLEGYGGEGIKFQSSTDLTDGQLLQSKYNITTPWRAIFSGSYVFREVANVENQRGFITADIEYVDYKGAAFHSVDNNTDVSSYYKSLNQTIDNLYKNAVNVRLGGELKFNTVMFRLGGAYYGNPYKNESADLVKLSGGLGYRNKGFFVDLTYVYSMNKDVHYPYLLDAPATNIPAYLKNNGGNIVMTFGFKI